MATAKAFEVFGDEGTLVVRTDDAVCVSGDINELLRFLQYTGKSVIRAVFDIDAFAAPFLRLLPTENVLELAEKQETVFGGYRIYYNQNHVFQVGSSDKAFGTRYYGVKNFLNIPGLLPPEPLEEVQKTGQAVLDAVDAIGFGSDRMRLNSPVSVFTRSPIGEQFMDSLPLNHDLPVLDAIEMGSEADHKYWVSAYQLGSWDEGEIYDYDLTGAFASVAAGLYDIHDLTFWKSDTIGSRERGAAYGLVEGKFYIYPDGEYAHASPIVFTPERASDLQINPVGHLPEDTYTLDEIRVVEQCGIGEFEQTGDGIFVGTLTSRPPRFPFKEMMNRLYDARKFSPMAKNVSKVMANAIIGKMIEKNDETARYRNYFYHAIITAKVRCMITRFLVQNDVRADELVCVQTDGVKLTRDIPCTNGGLGGWRNNGSAPTIVHTAHKVYTGDKRPYRISYADVQAMIAEHPNAQRYEMDVSRRLGLSEADRAGEIAAVGTIVRSPAILDLMVQETQQTRQFNKLPQSGAALLNNKYTSEAFLLED